MTIDRNFMQTMGLHVIRAGLVLNLGWQGLGKFTAAEATAIEPLISGSPLMSWTLRLFDLRTVSSGIGVIELLTTIALIVGIWSRPANDIAVAAASLTFLGTFSFLFTSIDYDWGLLPPSGFLLKDLVLLGASLALLRTARSAVRPDPNRETVASG
ncbi:hypothetical protein TTY48_34420 [Tsukamurella sp. TY48]|uniref:DUF417 family protein n=1 Tax=Tsukamurella TaxID=2060 RepID=UPI001C7DE9FC|nr:DUF417 family protein [Tsukamurella sp. TY48]GIZ98830.1 hypothetical protein TTY48_34420 [Tsukamurella sp. TY48]